MLDSNFHVLAVVGSLNRSSATRVVVGEVARRLELAGATVDMLDLLTDPIAVFNPDTARSDEACSRLKPRVERADAFLLGTPDYHGSMSGALKNFLDYFWHEFAGKLLATCVASHEKGLTVIDHVRTVARQCYAWSLPYGVSFTDQTDVKDGRIINAGLEKRVAMLARDLRVYGTVLASQRRADLACTDQCFMARLREP